MIKLHELNAPAKTKRAVKKYWKSLDEAIQEYKNIMKKAPKNTQSWVYRKLEKKANDAFEQIQYDARIILASSLGQEIMEHLPKQYNVKSGDW